MVFSLVAVVLHVPGLVVRLVNSDEASLGTMGAVLAHGGRLYRDTADRKPPIVPYVYAGIFRFTGSTDIRPVRVLGIAVLVATATLLAAEAKRRYGSDLIAFGCGLFFLVGYVAIFPDDSQAATFELFQLLPMTAAVVAASRARPTSAGICLAFATLCKQTAITTVIPIAYLLHRSRSRIGLGRVLLGFVGPIGVAALALGPRPFLLWTVTGNGGYLQGVGVGEALARGAGMTLSVAALELGLLVACLAAARWRSASVDLWLWLASAAVSVVVGFRFFGHYYLPLLAPASLIGASALHRMGRRLDVLIAGSLAAPAIVCAIIGFFPTGDAASTPLAPLAARLRAESVRGESIFVWGDAPELYWGSGRLPASRFVHTGFLTGSSGGRSAGSGTAAEGLPGAWTMLSEDLGRHPADLIVDTSTGRIREQQHYPMSSTPLARLVRERYQLIDVVEGVRVYRLASRS